MRAGLAPLNTQAAAAASAEQGAYDNLPDSPGSGVSTGAPHPLRPVGVHAYLMLIPGKRRGRMMIQQAFGPALVCTHPAPLPGTTTRSVALIDVQNSIRAM